MIHRCKEDVCNIDVPKDREYLLLVRDILEAPQVSLMKNYVQHGTTTCLAHSINVSYLSYLFCKKHGLNTRSVARAGLLHDLFLYDWHFHKRQKGELLHGFSHPRVALQNAEKAFSLTPLEKNIILRHMWPLTLTPPRYKEAYVVVYFDKYCSLMETLRRSVMDLREEQDERLAKQIARQI
ncbi:MAG: HD family phosphohydrolase [Ruthenibacterium sp.]